jgi:16S rRNA (cytidine1402-2'-O)-methyltransferase
LVSYRDENHERVLGKILEKLDMGLDLALISDAGTPLISDPGYKLVKHLRENDLEVISIPGPSALTAALSVSGLPTDRFVFFGFLPKSETRREKIISDYKDLHNTLVFYESPKRLIVFLDTIYKVLGDVKIFLAKDISKLREEYFYGNVSSVKEILNNKSFAENPHGEFVCVVDTRKD